MLECSSVGLPSSKIKKGMIVLEVGVKRLVISIMCMLILLMLFACGAPTSIQDSKVVDGNIMTSTDAAMVPVEGSNSDENSISKNTSAKIAHELKLHNLHEEISEEYNPYIKFYSDMHCELLVNMMEWVEKIEATYKVYKCDNEKLMILCDLGTTEFANHLKWDTPVFYLVQSYGDYWTYMGGDGIGAMVPESEFYVNDLTATLEVECTPIHTLSDQDVYNLLLVYYQEVNTAESCMVLEGTSNDDGVYFTQVRCGVPGDSADTYPFSTQPLYEVSVDQVTNLVVEEHMITHEVSYFILTGQASDQESDDYSLDQEQLQELSRVVDHYFEIVKDGVNDEPVKEILLKYESFESALEDESAVEELLEYESATGLLLKEEFPNYLDVHLHSTLVEAFWKGLVDGFSYEIVTANLYSMEQADARRMWATAIEEELYNGLADPDSFAEVLVKLPFNTQGKKSGVVGFCDFLLVQDDGTWGILFAGGIYSELPQMLFPL